MPVYECFCPDCHTVFNFFSRRVDTETRPACPRCGRPDLARQASLFAISKRRSEGDAECDPGLPAGVDEERMMRALASMEGEMEALDDADPEQAARLMRRLFDASGLQLGGSMAEAIRRMEAGEDPDQIDGGTGRRPAGKTRSADPDRWQGGWSDALRSLRRELLPAARARPGIPCRGRPRVRRWAERERCPSPHRGPNHRGVQMGTPAKGHRTLPTTGSGLCTSDTVRQPNSGLDCTTRVRPCTDARTPMLHSSSITEPPTLRW